jgi:hypothetical protein
MTRIDSASRGRFTTHTRLKSMCQLGGGWLVFIALALAALFYYPITLNYFRDDDFLNLYRINLNVTKIRLLS